MTVNRKLNSDSLFLREDLGGKMEKTSRLTQAEKNFFMRAALQEALLAREKAEVPIGAVVVLDGQIIGRGHNLRETLQQATAHAEIFAIQQACEKVGSWRLERSQLFVTLEPCVMCSGAIQLARVDEIYYGATDPKGGAAGSLLNIATDTRFNHWSYVESGILADECSQLLSSFFKELRNKKKKQKNASNLI